MSLAVVAGLFALTLSPQNRPQGYLAEPRSGHGRGVLVLHPWWGLNADVKGFCDRLARAGFVAFAPDLFEGKVVKTRKEAEALVHLYEPKQTELTTKIDSATRFLFDRTGGRPIAVVGFSFGAYYALHLSNADPDRVRATVVYYGTGQQEFDHSKSTYLGHFAERDEFEPKTGVDGLAKLLKAAGRPATFYTYPKTGHWFVEPSVASSYNRAAAELAWQRTLQFLEKNLK